MDLEIVKFVQSGATQFLDGLFSVLTRFGEEVFLVCVFLILYWSISYRYAFKFAFYYVFSMGVNGIIKSIVRRPRPWMASDEIVNKLPASGLSFPSGHSQTIATITTFISYDIFKNTSRKRYKIIISIVSILLFIIVGYSRLYLGQHYITDVLAGLILGILCIWIFKKIEKIVPKKIKQHINFEVILCVISIVLCIAIVMLQFIDLKLNIGSISKLYMYSAFTIGPTIGFVLSKRLVEDIKFSVSTLAIKTAVGLTLIFGMYAIINCFDLSWLINFVVIIILGVIATFVYPLVFNIIYKRLTKETSKSINN